jgi:hypothetical protein
VLVIDELGYLPLDQASANWIFQVVSRRYDRGSIILTSNRGFGDWNQVFADPCGLGHRRSSAPQRHRPQHPRRQLPDAELRGPAEAQRGDGAMVG